MEESNLDKEDTRTDEVGDDEDEDEITSTLNRDWWHLHNFAPSETWIMTSVTKSCSVNRYNDNDATRTDGMLSHTESHQMY